MQKLIAELPNQLITLFFICFKIYNFETWIKTMDRFLVAFVSLAAWSAAAVAQEEGKAHPQAVLG